MPTVEVKVPDIGDFSDVPVIDVLVKPGDTVKPEDPLVTLESDKATMDVPSPAEGTVKAIAVKIGDKVSEGKALLTLESAAPAAQPPSTATGDRTTPAQPPPANEQKREAPRAAAAPSTATEQKREAPQPASAPASFAGRADIECAMLVLGSGPGGYSAAFRAADLGM
jgi:dihydrolipoamide dehydrogenase